MLVPSYYKPERINKYNALARHEGLSPSNLIVSRHNLMSLLSALLTKMAL